MSVKFSDTKHKMCFGGASEMLEQRAAIAGGVIAASGASGARGVSSPLVPVSTHNRAAGGGGLLAFLAAVAPVALPVLAVGGAIALIASLASEDEKKEGNK